MEALKLNDHHRYKIGESALIKRILAGEKELYEILIRRNNQTLYRIIRSYINDHTEVEDIMQNSYLKAYEKLDQFKHTSSFTTWLVRIGINESLARAKERAKIRDRKHPAQHIESKSVLEIPDTYQMNPEKKMIKQETKQLLENAIDVLETKYKTVYILKEIEGMSIQEISECLELSVSNVKVRLHRAKNQLQKNLYDLTTHSDIFEFGQTQCDKITERVMQIII